MPTLTLLRSLLSCLRFRRMRDAQVLHTWPADYFRGPFHPGYFGVVLVGGQLYAKVASSTYNEAELEVFDTTGASVAGPVMGVTFASDLKSAPGVVSTASQGRVTYFDLNTLSEKSYTIPGASVASPMVIDPNGSWTTLTGIGGICGSDTRLQRISTEGESVVDVSLAELFQPTTLACESPSLVVLNDASTVIGTWRAGRSNLQLDLVDPTGDIRHLGDISSISGNAILQSDGAGHVVVAYNKHVDCQDTDVVKSCEQVFVDVYGADGRLPSASFGGTIDNSDFPVFLSVNDGSVGIEYSRWHDAGHASGVRQYSAIKLALETTRETWHDPAPESEPIKYVALGDSYSSGEGLPPYIDGTDESVPTENRCHRSLQAYGPLLRTDASLGRMNFAACSGAVTQDLFTTNHNNLAEPAQVSRIPESAEIVTLTIGGNDVGFDQVLRKCLRLRPGTGYGCSKDKKLRQAVQNRITALEGGQAATTPDDIAIIPIETVLKRIHRAAPSAKIYIAGYPHLFGNDTITFVPSKPAPSRYLCEVYRVGEVQGSFDYADTQWMNGQADAINRAISSAVTAANASGVPAVYVDNISSKFENHGLCDSHAAWIRPVSVLIDKLQPDPISFHPTATGQGIGYESGFMSFVSP
jgi:hypothetical protein